MGSASDTYNAIFFNKGIVAYVTTHRNHSDAWHSLALGLGGRFRVGWVAGYAWNTQISSSYVTAVCGTSLTSAVTEAIAYRGHICDYAEPL